MRGPDQQNQGEHVVTRLGSDQQLADSTPLHAQLDVEASGEHHRDREEAMPRLGNARWWRRAWLNALLRRL